VGSCRGQELNQANRVLPCSWQAGRPRGALRHVKTPGGKLLVEGKNVTGFTDGEEEDVGLTKVVPFLVEDELMKLGTTFSKVKNWGVHTVCDGLLITGQNPASSGPAAKVLTQKLKHMMK
jgi:putative intracellular protease/amidase